VKAVVERLGATPQFLKPAHYEKGKNAMRDWRPTLSIQPPMEKKLVGVDVFLHWNPKNGTPDDLANRLSRANEVSLRNDDGTEVDLGRFKVNFGYESRGQGVAKWIS
jgi:hypothetical protein